MTSLAALLTAGAAFLTAAGHLVLDITGLLDKIKGSTPSQEPPN